MEGDKAIMKMHMVEAIPSKEDRAYRRNIQGYGTVTQYREYATITYPSGTIDIFEVDLDCEVDRRSLDYARMLGHRVEITS